MATDLTLPAEPYRILPILLGTRAFFFFLFSAIGDLGEGERAEMHGGAVMGN